MKTAAYSALIAALAVLVGCSGGTPVQRAIPQTGSPASASGLAELFNLDYSHGAISVFLIQDGKATQTKRFKPGNGLAQGLASDAQGRIYTTVTKSSGKPCAACVEVFDDTGTLLKRLDSPVLSGASCAPALTDVSVDAHNNVCVSD